MSDYPAIGAVLDRIAARAAAAPERLALRETTGRALTYGALWSRAARTAAGLRAAGLAPGDPVAFMVRPGIDAVVLILALLRCGAVLVAADPSAGEAVFAARMARVRPRWLFAESPLFPIGRCGPLRRLLRRRGIALPDLGPLLAPVPAGPLDWGLTPATETTPPASPPGETRPTGVVAVGRWFPGVPRRALSAARLAAGPLPPDIGRELVSPGDTVTAPTPDHPAAVVFTSGTTDTPRAVVHGTRSLGAAVGMLAAQLALGPDDVVFSGEMHLILPALLAGGRVILPRERDAAPARTLALLEGHAATHTFAVPSAFDALCATAIATGRQLPATLRLVLLGSAPVTPPLLARCRPALGPTTRVFCAYAMTEILPVAAVSLEDKLAHDGDGDLVGAPLPGVGARIDDGELVLSGPNLCLGYLGGPPLAEHRTGDLARFDAAGRIVLAGRAKEMILRRGHNVYPGLLEGPIGAIPGVRACALVGLPTADATDERIVLVIEPGDDAPPDLADRVRAALRSGPHSLDPAELPDAIVAATLPRAGRSRKIDRRAAAALAARLVPAPGQVTTQP